MDKQFNEFLREEFKANPLTNVGNQFSVISMWISLGLLEEYHEWLQK